MNQENTTRKHPLKNVLVKEEVKQRQIGLAKAKLEVGMILSQKSGLIVKISKFLYQNDFASLHLLLSNLADGVVVNAELDNSRATRIIVYQYFIEEYKQKVSNYSELLKASDLFLGCL